MTYNFDPDTWYANERTYLDGQLKSGALDQAGFEAALADLDQRYEEMLDRLDGTYVVPSTGDTP